MEYTERRVPNIIYLYTHTCKEHFLDIMSFRHILYYSNQFDFDEISDIKILNQQIRNLVWHKFRAKFHKDSQFV
jgi:hypothetical protein